VYYPSKIQKSLMPQALSKAITSLEQYFPLVPGLLIYGSSIVQDRQKK